jgi:hypothetical protein
MKLRVKELHEEEKPIALLATQQAELNRDSKKRRKPFAIEDFCLYTVEEEKDSVDAIYGAAAITLIQKGIFPYWALFAYKDLSKNAEDSFPPSTLCLQSEEAIILAPTIQGEMCSGMLIALESASEKQLLMKSPCGKELIIQMPEIRSKVIAKEKCNFTIIKK